MPQRDRYIPKVLNNLGAATVVVAAKAEFAYLHVMNVSGATMFIQVFNKAALADVQLANTVPDWEAYIANNSDTEWWPRLFFDTGIVIASTTTNMGSTASAAPSHATVGYAN